MRHVYQIVGRFTYATKSLELPVGQADTIEKAEEQLPVLCDFYKNHKRGSDTFHTTLFIREAWTDQPWYTPYRISYIENILWSQK